MKLPKPPPNCPAVGDACRLRNPESKATGLLTRITDRNWAVVTWGTVVPGPKLVHLFELVKL